MDGACYSAHHHPGITKPTLSGTEMGRWELIRIIAWNSVGLSKHLHKALCYTKVNHHPEWVWLMAYHQSVDLIWTRHQDDLGIPLSLKATYSSEWVPFKVWASEETLLLFDSLGGINKKNPACWAYDQHIPGHNQISGSIIIKVFLGEQVLQELVIYSEERYTRRMKTFRMCPCTNAQISETKAHERISAAGYVVNLRRVCVSWLRTMVVRLPPICPRVEEKVAGSSPVVSDFWVR